MFSKIRFFPFFFEVYSLLILKPFNYEKRLFIFGALLALSFTTPSEVELTDSTSAAVTNEVEEEFFGCGPNGVGVEISTTCGLYCGWMSYPMTGIMDLDINSARAPDEDEITVLRGMAQSDCNATSIQA
jgi:hypothetical protein